MEQPCRADLNDAAEILRQADIGREDVCFRVASWLDRVAHVPERQADADGHVPPEPGDIARRFRHAGSGTLAPGSAAAPSGTSSALTTPNGPV